MKRLPVVAAAVVAGSIPFLAEIEDPECKDATCVSERVAKVPEPPHSLEELPAYEVPEGMVLIPSSPVITVPYGNEFHLQWVSENGSEFVIVGRPRS